MLQYAGFISIETRTGEVAGSKPGLKPSTMADAS